jgi:hypothetical protein
MARASSADHSLLTLRSPIPLLAGGIAAALLLIAFAALAARWAPPDGSRREILNEQETIILVAREMRSSEAALRVAREGKADFVEDVGWNVTVGDARFLFNDRDRILLPQNDAAREMQFRAAPCPPAASTATAPRN